MSFFDKKPDLVLSTELEEVVNLYIPSLEKHIKKYGGEGEIELKTSLGNNSGLFPIKKNAFLEYQMDLAQGQPWMWLEYYFKNSVKKIYDSFGIGHVKSLLNNWENEFWDPKIHNYLMLDYNVEEALGIGHNISAYPRKNFINKFIELINPNSLLDMNYILGDYALKNDFKRFLACTSSEYIYNAYKDVYGEKSVMKIPYDSDVFESDYEKINEEFDFIICSPPLSKYNSNTYGSLNKRYLNQAFNKASKEGFIVYIAPSDFIFREQFNDYLKTAPFFLNGILELDEKYFLHDEEFGQTKNFSIYVFSSKKTPTFFNSNLSVKATNVKMNTAVYKEFLQFLKDGKVLDYKKSELKHYVGFKNSKWNSQLQKKFKSTNLNELDFSKTIKEIKVVESESDRFDDVPNSIYFRKSRVNEAVFEDIKSSRSASLKDLSLEEINSVKSQLKESLRHANYIQVTLKEDFDSEYVCGYFNSKIGVETLKINKEGSFQANLSPDSIKRIKVYFPNIKIQRKIVENSDQINNQKLTLNELSLDLWSSNIFKDEKLFKRIEKIKLKDNGLQHWVDTLPFPISSSLYLYISSNDVSVKHEQLLRFFESFTQFMVVIIVSALNNDKEFYKNHKKEISLGPDWITNSSFGNWLRWYNRLRDFIKDKGKDGKNHIPHLISRGNKDFLEMITNKQIIQTLDRTLNIRNATRGHGGLASESYVYKQLNELEKYLYELRKRIEYGFESFKIIVPGKTVFYENNIYNYSNCKELIGKGSPFNEISLESSEPLVSNELYYQINEDSSLIKILPFIKYEEKNNAVYYYSKTKIDMGGLVYISHHYKDDKDYIVKEENSKLFPLLSELL